MALDRAKLTRYRTIAGKLETTTGTAISLSGTDASLIVMNFTMSPDDPVNEREAQGGLGQLQSAAGAQSGTCSFDVELAGSGASGIPSWASIFLPACDFENSGGTFGFVIGSNTVTIGDYEDGLLRTLSGSRGNFKITYATGKPGVVHFEFKGKYNAITDSAILTPTYPSVISPVFSQTGTVCTYGGFSPRLSTIEIDAGNEVVMREDENDATGYHAAAIVGRKPVGSMDPEATSVATRDWRSILALATQETLSVIVGANANNIMTLASTTCGLQKVARGNRNNLMTDQVSFALNGLTPFTLAFS